MTNYNKKITAILKCVPFAALSLTSLATLYIAARIITDSTITKLAKGGFIITSAIATSVSSMALNEFIEEAKEEFI